MCSVTERGGAHRPTRLLNDVASKARVNHSLRFLQIDLQFAPHSQLQTAIFHY
jgi:hypothetical protein